METITLNREEQQRVMVLNRMESRELTAAQAVSEAVRERVVALATGPYDGASHTHLSELLAEREGLFLSRSTVRQVLLQAGIKTPRHRRAPKHRRRRER